MDTMESTEERILTVEDRCDSCRAQAYYVTIFDSGELLFCRHHFMKFEDSLREHAFYIIDQSGSLA